MCKFVINSREILDNFSTAKKQLRAGVKVCAVVKAQAYGFGMSKICSLLKNRVDYFAVARLSEFARLYSEVSVPILILSPMSEKENEIAIKLGAEITINSATNLAKLEQVAKKVGKTAKVHLKIDTGMNRYGIKTKAELIKVLEGLKNLKNVVLAGCYSHLYKATNKKLSERQLRQFNECCAVVRQYGFKPIFHLANSAGLKAKNMQLDMVRLGFDLYAANKNSAHKLVCYINELKFVKKGETIGYNAHYKAKKDMRIAVVGAGYADGINRGLSKKGKVLINGSYAKIVGDICMDSFMVDVTQKNVSLFDEVIIFGRSGDKIIRVQSLARQLKTIPYEVYTAISGRVKRVYKWKS